MEQNIKFSVIIPAYNAESCIKRAVDSVLKNSYRNFEIIIINDGSIDNTVSIVERINDSRIYLVDKNNTGVSDSRNIGIQKATGKYLVFLDADDYLPDNLFSEVINSLSKISYSPDIVFGAYSRFDNYTQKKTLIAYNYESDLVDVYGLEIWSRLFGSNNLFSMPIMAQVYNRKFLIDNELFFDIKQFVSEDHDWRYKLLLKSSRYLNCDFCLYNYCENNASSVTNTSYSYKKYENSMQYLLKWNAFSQSEMCPSEIKRTLQDVVSQDFINHAVRILDIKDETERHRAINLFKNNYRMMKSAKPFKYKLSNLVYSVFGIKVYLLMINNLHRMKSSLLKKSVY